MFTRKLRLDYETASEVELKVVGLDVYANHPSTRVLMCAYKIDRGEKKLWVAEDGPMPQELIDCLMDPFCQKWAFNAQFERVITRKVLKLKTPYTNWRCTMALAYMQSFVGGLDMVGQQVGLPADKQKLKEGKRLIYLFCKPQRVTKNQPHRWRNSLTDPEDWALFCEYCLQDVEAEEQIEIRLRKFPVQDFEWDLYEVDQRINDRGIPIDLVYCENATILANRRREELTAVLRRLTGLANPNSPAQLLRWIKDRGYPFDDLRADTVKKVLTEYVVHLQDAGYEGEEFDVDAVRAFLQTADIDYPLAFEAAEAMQLRKQVARLSVKKYAKLMQMVVNGRFRFGFQFAGAQRTNRWAGRGLNPTNLTRTPKEIEPDDKLWGQQGLPGDFMLNMVTEQIRTGDYDMLKLTVKEPMDSLAGTVRSAVRAPDGYELLTCDLSSIESCVIAWVTGCDRLLNVFRDGKDPYIDFATDFYNKPYEDVTKRERQNSKPAVLGSGFRLGGGDLREGKRTGLWGYAENMGINLTRDESHKATDLFRKNYSEIPLGWYALENAVERCIRSRNDTVPIVTVGSRKFRMPVKFKMMKPYMVIELPSGRNMYYHKPRITMETRYTRPTLEHPEGRPYEKAVFSYMGREQGSNTWKRIFSHGGKIIENIVQAVARDILAIGMMRAYEYGFPLVMHVYDELVALTKIGDNRLTLEKLRELMIEPLEWMFGLPLNAAGSAMIFYRKE